MSTTVNENYWMFKTGKGGMQDKKTNHTKVILYAVDSRGRLGNLDDRTLCLWLIIVSCKDLGALCLMNDDRQYNLSQNTICAFHLTAKRNLQPEHRHYNSRLKKYAQPIASQQMYIAKVKSFNRTQVAFKYQTLHRAPVSG